MANYHMDYHVFREIFEQNLGISVTSVTNGYKCPFCGKPMRALYNRLGSVRRYQMRCANVAHTIELTDFVADYIKRLQDIVNKNDEEEVTGKIIM